MGSAGIRPVAVVAIGVRFRQLLSTMQPLTKSGIVLGLGLGGFLDGIVLHQILGWHHLVCTTETCQVDTVAALKLQTTQDGFFHLAVWILTTVGVFMLFRATRQPATANAGNTFAGALLVGWGLFNFTEGLIDHQILGIHHVRPGSPHELLFDLLFLASGVTGVLAGCFLVRRASRRSAQITPSRSV